MLAMLTRLKVNMVKITPAEHLHVSTVIASLTMPKLPTYSGSTLAEHYGKPWMPKTQNKIKISCHKQQFQLHSTANTMPTQCQHSPQKNEAAN